MVLIRGWLPVEEKITSRVSCRKRQIATILERLHTDNHLIISELSRFGRSMTECIEVLSIASQSRFCFESVEGII